MKNVRSRRRWWQFGLRGMLFVMLLASVYFAGRSHQLAEVEVLKSELRDARETAERHEDALLKASQITEHELRRQEYEAYVTAIGLSPSKHVHRASVSEAK